MRVLVPGEEVLERLAGEKFALERIALQILFPLRRGDDLAHQLHVVLLLIGRDAAGHHEHAQHLVLDVEPLLLAGRHVAPALRLGDLGGVAHPFGREHAQRTMLAGPPLADRFGRVVDVGVDVLARQLRGRLAAALVRHVDELGAGLLLDQRGDDLVLALGAGPAHLDLARAGLGALDEFGDGLVRRFGIGPQHELVLRHHRDRRQVAPAERQVADHRHRVQRGRGHQQLVRIALRRLGVHQALGTAGAGLVDHDDRLAHQLVLGDDALDRARHLVGRTARAERHDDLDRLGRLPCPRRGRRAADRERDGAERQHRTLALLAVLALHCLSPRWNVTSVRRVPAVERPCRGLCGGRVWPRHGNGAGLSSLCCYSLPAVPLPAVPLLAVPSVCTTGLRYLPFPAPAAAPSVRCASAAASTRATCHACAWAPSAI